MKPFLMRWLATTIAVAVAEWLLAGIHADGSLSLIVAALLLGIINAVIRPILLLLSLPFILFTLGFFILLVNALLLWIVGVLVPGFHVDGFWAAFFGAIIIGIVSWAFGAVFKIGGDGKAGEAMCAQDGIKRVEGRVIE